MAGVTIKTIIPKVDKRLKEVIRDAATDAANSAAARIKVRGRAMIRGSYSNMGGMANAFRVTVLPKNKKATTPALIASVNTGKAGYSKVFDRDLNSDVKQPITGDMWIPLPEARKLMGRKRITIGQWKRKLKFAKVGSTVIAFANVASVTPSGKNFRRAKNPRLIRRATKKDAEKWIPMFFLKKSITIRPQWQLTAIVRRQWEQLAGDYLAAINKRWN